MPTPCETDYRAESGDHADMRETISAMEAQLMANPNPNTDHEEKLDLLSKARRQPDPLKFLQGERHLHGEDSVAAEILNAIFA